MTTTNANAASGKQAFDVHGKPIAPIIMWEVWGSFIIPNTREKVSFGPIKVLGHNRTEASANLVPSLNEQFSKELQNVPRVAFQSVGFSKGFALYHLNWKQIEAKPAKQEKTQEDKAAEIVLPVLLDDRNDPPFMGEGIALPVITNETV